MRCSGWCEDFSFSFGVFVGTPIVVRDFVVGRPEGRQVLHTVEFEVGLLVSVFEFFKVACWPCFSVHVLEFLGMFELVSDGVMEESDAVFGSIIALE